MGCKAGLETHAGKLFAGVLVCEACHAMAESTYQASEKELRMLLVVLKDKIREALVTGKLRAENGTPDVPIDRASVLRRIAAFSDARRGS